MSFEDDYKVARNLIRSANQDDLITQIIMRIRQYEANPENLIKKGQPMPWLLFDILKMAFLFAGTNQDVKKVDVAYFSKIYNRMRDLDGVYQLALLQQDGHQSYLAAISQKQFWLQKGVIKSDFARTNYLFLSAICEYHNIFEERFGISVNIYIAMMLGIWAYTKMKNNIVYVDYVSVFTHYGFEKTHIENFLRLISRNKNELKSELQIQDKTISSPILKFGENTPLYRFPLLRIDPSSYICFGSSIVERSIYFSLFEFVKSLQDNEGAACFAERFEKYVGCLINDSGAKYISENQIKKLYEGKRTDYLVIEDDHYIMVEAKSIRLGDYAKANPERRVILNDLEDSVVKSIFQGHELSKNIQDMDADKKFSLIIVCYDDLYLGPPLDAYNHFFKDYCEQKFNDGACVRGSLSAENIFMIGINEFERFCAARQKINSFSKILDAAIADNRIAETRKFTLDLSFPDLGDHCLDIIDENFEEIWASLTDRMGHSIKDSAMSLRSK